MIYHFISFSSLLFSHFGGRLRRRLRWTSRNCQTVHRNRRRNRPPVSVFTAFIKRVTASSLAVIAFAMLLRAGIAFGLEGNVRESFDFGQLDLNAEVSHSFVLRSPVVAGLAIKKVSTSCTCAVVQSCPDTIDAGRDGSLDVRVIADSVGDFAYEVELQFTDETVAPWIFLMLVSVEGAMPDSKLYMKPIDLKSALTRRNAPTVIDVRTETLFRQVRVKDSLHIPSHTIRFKPWLRSRDIVLVDEGMSNRDTEVLCLRLIEEGFRSVAILQEGIAGWQNVRGDLDGDPAMIVRGAPMLHRPRTASPIQLAGNSGSRHTLRINGGAGSRRRKCGSCP